MSVLTWLGGEENYAKGDELKNPSNNTTCSENFLILSIYSN